MSGARPAWAVVGACLLAHLGLAARAWWSSGPETYVLTPYVEVVPGAAPLDAASAARLREELSGPVDARKIKHGYAWIGSTLSLQDLVAGIADLERAGLPLSPAQRAAIGAQVTGARQAYGEMLAVQDEILRGEAELEAALRAVAQGLPAEQRARVEAALQHHPGGRPPGGPPPGGPPPGSPGPSPGGPR